MEKPMKKPVTSEEEMALVMTYASLTMAAQIRPCPGSAVKMLSQVALMLAEGDDDAALQRLTEYVARRKGG